jgi:dUTP pyrophosphatase
VIQVPIRRLDPTLPLPGYAKPGDAGLDLVAVADAHLEPAGGRALVGTGMGIALPHGWAGLVLSRSGLAARHGVAVLNAPGLIDSGYRGEIMVPLVNTDPTSAYQVHRGDRIAQLLLIPVTPVWFSEVDQLDGGEGRGGGFGHTGR